MRSLVLRVALPAADALIRALPARAAYGLAWLLGRAWHRFDGRRRALVTETLGRVLAASERPSTGRALRRTVERAFVEHARYWVEMLRAPGYPLDRLDEIVTVEPGAWERVGPAFRSGAVVAVPHLGNFEPFGFFVVAQGLRVVAPIEEIEPRELFDFLMARRVGGQPVEILPLRKATRPMLAALRDGGVAALVADRDLAGDGVAVTMFGHATTLPAGPAELALRTGRPLIMARVLRAGPDRFAGNGWIVEAERSGDRDADVATLTRALAARFEAAILEAPEQWWASFQPFFSDQRGGGA